jgi:hypothetical protein
MQFNYSTGVEAADFVMAKFVRHIKARIQDKSITRIFSSARSGALDFTGQSLTNGT